MVGKIQKDEIVILSTGSYSDYGIITITKALVDFDIVEVFRSFAQEHGWFYSTGDLKGVDEEAFILHLVQKGYIQKISKVSEYNIETLIYNYPK